MKAIKELCITDVQLILLCILIIGLPYSVPAWYIGTFSIAIFILNFVRKEINYKSILSEKILILFFSFVIFSFLSVSWSIYDIPGRDLQTNIDRFKYFFLLIPTLYYANFNSKQVQLIIKTIVFSPSIAVLIYYSNAFGLTNIYPHYFGDGSVLFSNYLHSQFFIVISSIYFYAMLYRIHSLKSFIVTFILFIFFSGALFVDVKFSSRLLQIVFFLTIACITFLINTKKSTKIYLLILYLLGTLILFNSQKFQRGMHNFKTAITQDKYSGSWGSRTGYTIVGLKIFLEKPFFGNSINGDVLNKIDAMKSTNPKYFKGEEHVTYIHNGHVNFLAQLGIVGYVFLMYVFYQVWKLKIDDQSIDILRKITLITFFIGMFGMHYLSLKNTAVLFAILVALCIQGQKQIVEKDTANAF